MLLFEVNGFNGTLLREFARYEREPALERERERERERGREREGGREGGREK